MNIPQRDIATAEAAKLVLSSLQRVLSDTKAPRKLTQSDLIPVFGIRWGAQVIRRITSARLCNILCSLRNSKLDPLTYRLVSLLWQTASETVSGFPTDWPPWRVTIERFNLDDVLKLSDWVEIVDNFAKLGWDSPQKLALVSSNMIRLALEGFHKATFALQLWTASALLFADLSSASFLILKGAAENAEKFLDRLKSAKLCSGAARSDVKSALNRSKISKIPINFDKLGPMGKIKSLKKAQLPQFKLNRFFRTASQSVALTGIHRCFKSFASCARCYYAFCELRGTPPFPVRGRIIVEWISIFKAGSVFSNYVGYVRKACFFTWGSPFHGTRLL